jgi:hypothetical protein
MMGKAGYYPNSSDHVEIMTQSVRDVFKDTDITISTDGKGYLGGINY